MSEQKAAASFRKFIEGDSSEPFFAYYGMRSGHGPFNSPERFRGKSKVGILGDMTLEADDIIGDMWKSLEKSGKINNTVVLFFSDNGPAFPAAFGNFYNHDQTAVTNKDGRFKLKGGKNDIYEGGHRLPFMVWYPKKFPAQQNFDHLVSQLDIYRTLADLIGAELPCHEAPDSRSLLPILTGENLVNPFAENVDLIHHGMEKNFLALRQGNFKWIPVSNELFDLSKDMEEKNNLFRKNKFQGLGRKMNETLFTRIANIEAREKRNQKGTISVC